MIYICPRCKSSDHTNRSILTVDTDTISRRKMLSMVGVATATSIGVSLLDMPSANAVSMGWAGSETNTDGTPQLDFWGPRQEEIKKGKVLYLPPGEFMGVKSEDVAKEWAGKINFKMEVGDGTKNPKVTFGYGYAGPWGYCDGENVTVNPSAPPDMILSILAHEVGHSIGLNHTMSTESVMHPAISGVKHPSQMDADGLVPGYGKPEGEFANGGSSENDKKNEKDGKGMDDTPVEEINAESYPLIVDAVELEGMQSYAEYQKAQEAFNGSVDMADPDELKAKQEGKNLAKIQERQNSERKTFPQVVNVGFSAFGLLTAIYGVFILLLGLFDRTSVLGKPNTLGIATLGKLKMESDDYDEDTDGTKHLTLGKLVAYSLGIMALGIFIATGFITGFLSDIYYLIIDSAKN